MKRMVSLAENILVGRPAAVDGFIVGVTIGTELLPPPKEEDAFATTAASNPATEKLLYDRP